MTALDFRVERVIFQGHGCLKFAGRYLDGRGIQLSMFHVRFRVYRSIIDIFRDENGPSFVTTHVTHHTVDPWPTWTMTNGHYVISSYAWDQEVAWHGGTGQPSRSWEQKKSRLKFKIKIKPPAMIIWTNWVSEQFLNVN